MDFFFPRLMRQLCVLSKHPLIELVSDSHSNQISAWLLDPGAFFTASKHDKKTHQWTLLQNRFTVKSEQDATGEPWMFVRISKKCLNCREMIESGNRPRLLWAFHGIKEISRPRWVRRGERCKTHHHTFLFFLRGVWKKKSGRVLWTK